LPWTIRLDRTPVRVVSYQVMLPDDSIRTGQLDDEGRARIFGINSARAAWSDANDQDG